MTAVDWREAMQLAIDYLKETKHGSPSRSAGHNARLVLEAALASSPAPTGAEPAAWMVLRKGNLHLPVLTSKEDAVRYQQYNPEETLQPLYASPQAVLAEDVAALVERLKDGVCYNGSQPTIDEVDASSDVMREAAAALTSLSAERDDAIATAKLVGDQHRRQMEHDGKLIAASEAEAADLRRKLEEARKALEPFATVGEIFEESAGWSDTDEIELSPEDGPRMAVVKLSHFRRARSALESDNG